MSSAAVRRRTVIGLAVCFSAAACTSDGERGASAEARDWRNATYVTTCDEIAPAGFRAPLVDGTARVPADASRPPHYDHYDVAFEAEATGDIDGDHAADTVVLLQCSPQPSNGILQEIQVFSATGDLLGTLPSPRTLREGTYLAPVYDPTGLSVEDGDIVATMMAYGAGDSHASGPSVPITVRWHWDGQEFVRAHEPA
jgi:hypothetical protein